MQPPLFPFCQKGMHNTRGDCGSNIKFSFQRSKSALLQELKESCWALQGAARRICALDARPMQHENSNFTQLLQPVWQNATPKLYFVRRNPCHLPDVSQAVPPVQILHRALPQDTTMAHMHFGAVRFRLLCAHFYLLSQYLRPPFLASMPKAE